MADSAEGKNDSKESRAFANEGSHAAFATGDRASASNGTPAPSKSPASAKNKKKGASATDVKQNPNAEVDALAKLFNVIDIKVERSEEYEKLLQHGLSQDVAAKMDAMFVTGKLSHCDLDDRAIDALKELSTQSAISVLAQFHESNLKHVSNKSAYLCGMIKTYRQKARASSTSLSVNTSLPSLLNNGGHNGAAGAAANKGPDEEKIKAILNRSGYTLDITTGQRKYGGLPLDGQGDPPGNGCEVFCGGIPREMYEDELLPMFEKCGKIWDFRLMMDPLTGLNRGYAFVTFTTRDAAYRAVQQLNSYDLGEGRSLKVNVSVPKMRLFIGNIPKNKSKEDIEEQFHRLTEGLKEAIIYSSPDDMRQNRGFCFLEYESHKAASHAKRRLEAGRVKVWSCDIIVDWADPQEEPDDAVMSQVRVLYVRNLTSGVTEDRLREVFERFGKVDRVKKIKDYAFVHFENRAQAVTAMDGLNGTELQGADLEISLAKPPSDKKKKEEMLRRREQRMMRSLSLHMPPPPVPYYPACGPVDVGAGMFHQGPGSGGLGFRPVMPPHFDNSHGYFPETWGGDFEPWRNPIPMAGPPVFGLPWVDHRDREYDHDFDHGYDHEFDHGHGGHGGHGGHRWAEWAGGHLERGFRLRGAGRGGRGRYPAGRRGSHM